MESYPKELLEGVSPLIFTVDAVLNKQRKQQHNPSSHNSSNINSNVDTGGNHNQEVSIFDLFYNSIASQKSIKDRLASTPQNSNNDLSDNNCNTTTPASSPSPPASKLKSFRYFKSFTYSSTSSSTSTSTLKSKLFSTKKDFFSHAYIVPVSNRHAFPPSKDPSGNQNQNISLNNKLYKSISTSLLKRSATTNNAPSSSSYSSSVTGSMTATTTAITESSMTTTHSTTFTSSSSTTTRTYDNLSPSKRKSVYNILSSTPIQGILPSGWIEKHVHALPSTLLFVTELDNHNNSHTTTTTTTSSSSDTNSALYDQALLEQHLLHTIENISSTMAKKRDAPIHLVMLIKVDHEKDLDIIHCGNTSSSVGISVGSNSNTSSAYRNPSLEEKLMIQQERVNSIKSVLRLNSNSITMLHYYINDDDNKMNTTNVNINVENDTPSTNSNSNNIKFHKKQFLKLQQNIYDNSNLYYLTQVRRFKRKYALLHHDKIYDLLPLAIRYCIKIAIFYEFQCCSLNASTGTGKMSSNAGSSSSSGGGGDNTTLEEEKLKREKSIKYWKEAYKNVIDYYTFIVEKEIELRGNDNIYSQKMIMKSISEDGMHSPSNVRKGMMKTDDIDVGDEVVNDVSHKKVSSGTAEMKVDTQHLITSPTLESQLLPPPPPSTPVQGGVEVALSGVGGVTIGAKTPNNKDFNNNNSYDEESMTKLTHSEDMIHQCRAVADWLNVKILLLTLSKTKTDIGNDNINLEGVVAIANQVRKHSQVFLSKPLTLSYGSYDLEENTIRHLEDPAWYFWQYVAHQRQVLSEFMEQHVNIPSDILIKSLRNAMRGQFSASKHYIATGESLLQLGLAVKNEAICKEKRSNKELSMKRRSDINSLDNRQRFVGSLAHSELLTLFNEERRRSHTGVYENIFYTIIDSILTFSSFLILICVSS